MWLVFLLFIFIVGIINSTVEANLYRIEFKNKKLKIKLVINFKLFGIIKIMHAICNENEIKFFNKKITYDQLILKAKKDNLEISKINLDFFKYISKKIDLKLKKVYFNLRVGLVDISLTNIIVVLLSSIFPILINSKVNRKNVKYEILPEYNKVIFYLNGRVSISIKSLKLIKLYFKNIKPEITHNKSKKYDVKESW